MIIDNKMITALLDDKTKRRALATYALLCGVIGASGYTVTTLSSLMWALGFKVNTSSKEYFANALDILDSLGVICLYADRSMTNTVDSEYFRANANRPIIAELRKVELKSEFTSLPTDSVDKIIMSETALPSEELFCVFAYIVMRTERRSGVMPVSYETLESIARATKMKERRVSSIVNQLCELKVLYVKQASVFGASGRKVNRNIYGMYADSEMVDQFVDKVELMGGISRGMKNIPSSQDKYSGNEPIRMIDNDNFEIDESIDKLIKSLNIECNRVSAKAMNEYAKKNGVGGLSKAIGNSYFKIRQSDNPTGYLIHVLSNK